MDETCGFWNKSCCISERLDGKVAIVTGADGGLGFYITTELARRGATVVMACLDMEEGEQTKEIMLDKYGLSNPRSTEEDIACDKMKEFLTPIKAKQLIVRHLDLSSMASIRTFVDIFLTTHAQLHYLINNAGVMCSNYKKTIDGLEMTMGVNYLGHFLLTELLLPILKVSAPSRIISTSSVVHYLGYPLENELQLSLENYWFVRAYFQSKLAMTTYMGELARRLAGTEVITASVHPGLVKTNFEREMTSFYQRFSLCLLRPLYISPWQGIQTILYAILSPTIQSGGYYTNCTIKQPSKVAQDEQIQDWLRNKSRELVGLQSTD